MLIERQTFLAAVAETKFFRFMAGTAVFLPIVDCSSDCQRPALLVIEIADSTLAYDREAKGSLYARFGIPEYWIVNLVERLVEVCRHPEPDDRARFGFSYHPLDRYHAADVITTEALPGARIVVADLLP